MAENIQQDTAWNMLKYGLSMIQFSYHKWTELYPYFPVFGQNQRWFCPNKGKYGYDSAHIRENMDQRKPIFRHISHSERTGVGC